MSQTPYFPFYAGDYLGDTIGLSLEGHGAYMKLLLISWNNGGPLPDDDAELCLYLGVTKAKWLKLRARLEKYFIAENGVFYSKRLEKEREKTSAKVNKNRANASLGGIAKSLKNKETGLANATQTLEPNPSERSSERVSQKLPIPEPEPEPYSKKDILGDLFDQLWPLYPKRSGANPKAKAKTAVGARLRDNVTPLELVEGVKRYAAWCEITGKIDTEFIMQAARFFGPDEHFRNQFTPPKEQANGQRSNLSKNLDAIDRLIARKGGADGGDNAASDRGRNPEAITGFVGVIPRGNS